MATSVQDTAEGRRIADKDARRAPWILWGPYLSDRSWGTVREDYSADGNAWEYFPHDHARSRAYRWNEDGLAGLCDSAQRLCFAIALWNGRDPILKERLFGLGGNEGNHGEDVKEEYFHLDNTPTHSYMRFLYKYPQEEFPYARLLEENRRRTRADREFELVDTGIFAQNRYFDVVVEYAKASPEDVLIRITATNRGPDPASLHILPTLWFRNTWSWGGEPGKPSLAIAESARGGSAAVRAVHDELGEYLLHCRGADEIIFTENESNTARLWGTPPPSPWTKDAFHERIVHGRADAVNPQRTGTKAAAVHVRSIPPGASTTVDLRLVAAAARTSSGASFDDFDGVLAQRRRECDEFYAAVIPSGLGPEGVNVARRAFAGMLWSLQFYHYVVSEWLDGDPAEPRPPASRRGGRNHLWRHLYNADVVSMPDKWEFPWYAAWDLAFHAVTLARIDPGLAKAQILLLTREWYMHPDGQLPAYEWCFDDVNPPVHAWAAHHVYRLEREATGRGDRAFLERIFHKLIVNFTRWINREDALGNNIFEGGFLGLDNIGPFDRSGSLPAGWLLGQSDGTSWMAMYCLNMLAIALELAVENPVYDDIAVKFWEHFIRIADAMNHPGDTSAGLWDADDGFFYDVLRAPDGTRHPIRARTVVGLIPLLATVTASASVLDRHPVFAQRRQWFLANRPYLTAGVAPVTKPGNEGRLMLALVRPEQLRSILSRLLDESEFLSPWGIRSVSRFHLENPCVVRVGAHEWRLDYEPGEGATTTFGGNSNWRGPVWMQVNCLVLDAMLRFHEYYGDGFTVECPTGSGRHMTLAEVAGEIGRRLISLFVRGADGRLPLAGDHPYLGRDPAWRDLMVFPEYFDGDTGRGCGAMHQTGWTGLVAPLLLRWTALTGAERRRSAASDTP